MARKNRERKCDIKPQMNKEEEEEEDWGGIPTMSFYGRANVNAATLSLSCFSDLHE